MFWKLGRPSQGSVSLANTILPESEPAPGFPVSLGLLAFSHLCSPAVRLATVPSERSRIRIFWASPIQTVFSGLWSQRMCWNLQCWCRRFRPVSAQMSVTFIPSTFMPHHFLNEKPQNTSLVRYKIVCKANEEVINTLFFDRMRLLADGVWKVSSPSLSFLAPGPD